MPVNYEVWLSAIALVLLGGMGMFMLFQPIPQANAQSVTFVLGALAGAITMAGGNKIAKAVGGGSATTGPDQAT